MRTIFHSFLLTVGISFLMSCTPQNLSTEKDIIPFPVEVANNHGVFTFKSDMSLYINDKDLVPARMLLQNSLGIDFLENHEESSASIVLRMAEGIMEKDGGYHLSVNNDKLLLEAPDYSGIVAGISTIRQLLPIEAESGLSIPNVEITDYPHYQWRGMHLDVSRHFYSKEEVMKLLDLMSLYKFNKFHWHLTDDQGWRIEIKKYPLLTEKGAWRTFNDQDRTCMQLEKSMCNPDYAIPAEKTSVIEGDTIYGGFYTQEEIKEIVNYASDRGIDVIPEIDMPGHFLAAIQQYPDIACDGLIGWGQVFSSPICVGKDSTLEFCKNIWREVFQLFPYEYVHLGGDEVDKTNWNKCKDCQKRMKSEGLATPEALQAWFVREMEAFFLQNGKRLVGWDEVVEDGLSDKSVISWWRSWCTDAVHKATAAGMKTIICPNSHLYFDYEQKADFLKKIYDMDVVPSGLSDAQKSLVWGVQCNVWTEWIPTMERMEYMVFPRMMAVSEIAWCEKSRLNDYKAFEQRVMNQLKRLDKLGVNYRIPDLTGFYDRNVFVDKGEFKVDCILPQVEIRYTVDGTEPSRESALYTAPVSVTENTEFKFRAFRPDGTYDKLYTASFVKEAVRPALKVTENLKPGLNVTLYDFSGNKCADIASSKLVKNYVSERIAYPEGKTGNLAMAYNGYLEIPSDGVYTFSLLSDDGSILKLDNQVLIENDGLHSPAERSAQVALAAGLHKLELSYFDYFGGVLALYLINEKGEKTECPSEWLKHE